MATTGRQRTGTGRGLLVAFAVGAVVMLAVVAGQRGFWDRLGKPQTTATQGNDTITLQSFLAPVKGGPTTVTGKADYQVDEAVGNQVPITLSPATPIDGRPGWQQDFYGYRPGARIYLKIQLDPGSKGFLTCRALRNGRPLYEAKPVVGIPPVCTLP